MLPSLGDITSPQHRKTRGTLVDASAPTIFGRRSHHHLGMGQGKVVKNPERPKVGRLRASALPPTAIRPRLCHLPLFPHGVGGGGAIAPQSDRRLLPRRWIGGRQSQRGGAKIANYPREFLDGHAAILPIDESPHRQLGHFEADAVTGARGRAVQGVM